MEKKEVMQEINNILSIAGKAENTKKMYCFYVNKYLDFLKSKDKNVQTANEQDMVSFIANYMDKSARTRSLIKVVLVFLYDRVLDQEQIVKSFNRKIPSIKIPHRETIFLQHKEVMELINSMPIPFYLVFKTQYLCGLRISEIAKLSTETVKSKKLIGKGNKERKIFMPDELRKELADYYNSRKHQKGYVFYFHTSTLLAKFKQYIIKAGFDEKITPHILRRSFTTNMKNSGYEIEQIKDWLGHSSINITFNSYVGVTENKNKKGLYF